MGVGRLLYHVRQSRKGVFRMKSTFKTFGTQSRLLCAIAIASVIGFSVMACSSGGGGTAPEKTPQPPQTVSYSSISGGSAYILTITEKAARYAANTGDDYVLEIIKLSDSSTKTSKGKVTGKGSPLQLTPDGGSPFTVTVDGGKMTKIEGTITLTDNTPQPAPGSLTPNGLDASLNGTWTMDSGGSLRLLFNSGSYEQTWKDTDGKYYPEWKGTYTTATDSGKKYLIRTETHEANAKREWVVKDVFWTSVDVYSISGSTLTLGDYSFPFTK